MLAALIVLITVAAIIAAPFVLMAWQTRAIDVIALPVWLALAALAGPIARGRMDGRMFLLLAMAGLVARVWPMILTQGLSPAGDAQIYPALAGTLLNDGTLHIVDRDSGIDMWAFYPPMFPLMLSVWSLLFGLSTVSIFLLNLIIDVATAAAIIALGRRLVGKRAEWVAAWWYLIWPSTLMSVPFAQKEGLAVLLTLLIAIGWLDLARHAHFSVWRALGIGGLAAVLALLQPLLAPIVLWFALALVPWAQGRRLIGWMIIVGGSTALLMVPWWLRNWAVLGAFVPLTSAGPVSLWVGNNPAATGYWMPTPRARPGMNELDYGRYLGATAMDWINAHKRDFVMLTARKAIYGLSLGHYGVGRLSAAALAPPWLGHLAIIGSVAHIAVLGGTATALARCWRSIPSQLIWLLAVGFAHLLLFGLWFEFGERHRDFLMPILFLIAASLFSQARPGEAVPKAGEDRTPSAADRPCNRP
ncbi:hypothetical protein ACNI3Q_14030 [Sphingomonas sp. FW199]|uniref:hypothetical protein n=1 Tax=Sphingomonas sp. FW199 TaxID=3400217 RepID=UPI003CF7858F